MRKVLYYFGLVCIALFLFATHSKFLHSLDPDKETTLFVFLGYDLKVFLPYVFGGAFGIVTAIIIAQIKRTDYYFWHFLITVSLLEFIGVFLYNNTQIIDNIWNIFASVYYATYAGFLVLMYGYIDIYADSAKMQKDNSNDAENNSILQGISERDAKLLRKLAKGAKPVDLAKEFKVDLSTIYRVKNKYSN